MNESGKQRVEHAERCQSYADTVHQQSAGKVSHDDATASPGYLKRLDKLEQVIAKQNNIGALTRHVGSRSHRDSYISLHEGGRIVNAVANHGYLVTLIHQRFDLLHLLLWQKIAFDRVHTKLLADRGGNSLDIAGQQDRSYIHTA